jgi:hypothetical protein
MRSLASSLPSVLTVDTYLTLVLGSNASVLLTNQALATVTSALALSVQGNVNLVSLCRILDKLYL